MLAFGNILSNFGCLHKIDIQFTQMIWIRFTFILFAIMGVKYWDFKKDNINVINVILFFIDEEKQFI